MLSDMIQTVPYVSYSAHLRTILYNKICCCLLFSCYLGSDQLSPYIPIITDCPICTFCCSLRCNKQRAKKPINSYTMYDTTQCFGGHRSDEVQYSVCTVLYFKIRVIYIFTSKLSYSTVQHTCISLSICGACIANHPKGLVVKHRSRGNGSIETWRWNKWFGYPTS